MKHGISFALALLVPWLGFAQFSPPPVIDHYGGMSLDASISIGDSTFCRASRTEVDSSSSAAAT